jgi:hypothetical protein
MSCSQAGRLAFASRKHTTEEDAGRPAVSHTSWRQQVAVMLLVRRSSGLRRQISLARCAIAAPI